MLNNLKKWPWQLFIAFLISALGHVILFFTLEKWEIAPSFDIQKNPIVIEARLVPMQPVKPQQKVIEQRKETEKTNSLAKPKIESTETTIQQEQESPISKELIAEPEVHTPTPATPASEQLPIGPSINETNESISPTVDMNALPRQLLIRFTVNWGQDGIGVGKAEYAWMREEDGTYILQSTTESSGVINMLKSMKLIQTSAGEITPNGLRPNVFSLERTGKPNERALFDWNKNNVQLENGEKKENVSLPPGTQDIMSILFQFAFVPPSGNELQLPIVMGRKLETYRLTIVGEEEIHSPKLGNLRTLHLRRITEDEGSKFDVWLAQERHYLPVRILRTDKKDSRPIELIASEILVPEKN